MLSPAEIEQRKSTMSKAHLKKISATTLSEPLSTWMWKLADKTTFSSKGGEVQDEGKDDAFGAEVGVGEDWGHLNKRRQRTREEQVERDVKWVTKLRRVRGRVSS